MVTRRVLVALVTRGVAALRVAQIVGAFRGVFPLRFPLLAEVLVLRLQ